MKEKTFDGVKNLEPEKHSEWKLYTKKEALKLKLVPFLVQYLKNL